MNARRIIAVGDTHLPRFGRSLPLPLTRAVAAADLVLHVGDITEAFVLDLLAELAPTIAVAGNNDGAELQERLGLSRVVEISGTRIGMTHGHHGPGRTTADRALACFVAEATPVDAVLFGHSHRPIAERRNGTWLLNPGSPTDRRTEAAFSFMEIDVVDERLEPRIVRFGGRAPAAR